MAVFVVSTLAEWNAAVAAINVGGAQGGQNVAHQITVTSTINVNAPLTAIDLPQGSTLSVFGGTFDGGGAQQGLVVNAGAVTLSGMTFRNMAAQGADGAIGVALEPLSTFVPRSGGGGGGGAGLGGGLSVGAGASVVIGLGTTFTNCRAIGGDGGDTSTFAVSGTGQGGRGTGPNGLGDGGAGGGAFSVSGSPGEYGAGGGGGGPIGGGAQGGFGGGSGLAGFQVGGEGGGGAGLGGAIFVQEGGSLSFDFGSIGGGGVQGGVGFGGVSTDGRAFGSGIFIQGANTIRIGAQGMPATIADVIADEKGSLSGANGVGGVLIGGVVTLTGANSYVGATTINAGATLLLGAGGATGTISNQSAIVLNGMLVANRSGDIVMSNALSGAGALQAVASSNVDLSGMQIGAWTGSITITGLSSANTLRGTTVRDTINGGAAGDAIAGSGGNDTLIGNGGDDTISGTGTLNGGAGVDTLTAGGAPGDVTLDGGADDDVLIVNGGANFIVEADGGEGIDELRVSGAVDFGDTQIVSIEKLTFAGAGASTFQPWGPYVVPGAGGFAADLAVTGSAGRNTISIYGGIGPGGGAAGLYDLSRWTFASWSADDALIWRSYFPQGPVTYRGAAVADQVLGTGFSDDIAGNGGNDTLNGDGGNDILDGGTGADVMRGGAGDDRYVVDAAGDVTDETGGSGLDTVFSSVSRTLSAGIERLFLLGTGNLNAGGRAGQNDLLFGNAGDNVLDGLSGVDYMRGGLGNDTYRVDASGDRTDETTGGGGIDNVFSTVSRTVSAGIERLFLLGAADINAIGLATQDDLLFGNAGRNVINGLGGVDYMRGGLGDDTYHVDHIGDRTDETIGGGGTLDTVVSSVSFTAAAGIERLFLSGAGAIDATGRNGQAEILIGNAGANRLDGRGGNDTLTGGLGADRFTFSSALNAATNIDRITDFVSGTDKIGLSATVFAAVNAVGAGLQAGEFRLGPAAADANDHIVYNRATGQLFYDANGAAAGGQIFFARLAPGAALAATDFVMA